jgi:hypothetical protein
MPIKSNIPDPKLGPNEELFYVIIASRYGTRGRNFWAQCGGSSNNPLMSFLYETKEEAERANKIKGDIERIVLNTRNSRWYLVEDPAINNKWRRQQ